MIEISETLPSYRLCNGCKSGDDVREIIVSFSIDNHSVGSVIALCRSCRSELIEVLRGASDETAND